MTPGSKGPAFLAAIASTSITREREVAMASAEVPSIPKVPAIRATKEKPRDRLEAALRSAP
jgi:hypothetical protein